MAIPKIEPKKTGSSRKIRKDWEGSKLWEGGERGVDPRLTGYSYSDIQL